MSPAYATRVEALEEARAAQHERLNAHQTRLATNEAAIHEQAQRIDRVLILLVTAAFTGAIGMALQIFQMVKR